MKLYCTCTLFLFSVLSYFAKAQNLAKNNSSEDSDTTEKPEALAQDAIKILEEQNFGNGSKPTVLKEIALHKNTNIKSLRVPIFSSLEKNSSQTFDENIKRPGEYRNQVADGRQIALFLSEYQNKNLDNLPASLREKEDFSSAVGNVKSVNPKSSFRSPAYKNSGSREPFNPIQMLMTKYMLTNGFLNRFRKVKDEYRRKEYERRIAQQRRDSVDPMTGAMRNILLKFVNKFEKNTDTLEVLVEHRKEKLRRFLEIPFISNIMENYKNDLDETRQSGFGEYGEAENPIPKFSAFSQQWTPLNSILDVGSKLVRFLTDLFA